jgi:hypothetical protein
MRKAKLIKQKEWQKEWPKEWPREQEEEQIIQLDNSEPRKVRTPVETAREWVKEHQTAERPSPRKRFAALFS